MRVRFWYEVENPSVRCVLWCAYPPLMHSADKVYFIFINLLELRSLDFCVPSWQTDSQTLAAFVPRLLVPVDKLDCRSAAEPCLTR